MANYGFFVDLRGAQFDENSRAGWVHAMSVGEYKHPIYGSIQFTADRLKRFADNVAKRVRGIDLDIDYDHKEKTTEAAGWVKQAEVRNGNQLWLFVEWTQSALSKIKEGAYRYFSPEFRDEWEDNQGQRHSDVLFGGGITNRPFLKDLLPLNLSELVFNEPPKEFKLDPKALRAKLGLPEDATDEQVSAALDAKLAAGDKDTNTGNQTDDNKKDDDKSPEDQQLSELKKLSESNPLVKLLMEQQATQQKQLAEMQASLKLAEVTTKLHDLNKGAYSLTPVALELARDILVAAPKTLSEKVDNLLKLLTEGKATVKLGETGGSSGNRETSGDPAKQLNEAINKTMADNKVDYATAYDTVLSENPALAREYLASMR